MSAAWSPREQSVDFFVAHEAFGVWSCRDAQDVNSQQQFRYSDERDAFCLLSNPTKCLQEDTSVMLY